MPFYQSKGQPERQRRDLHYDDRTPASQPARPLTPQVGRWFGKLDGALSQGSTATFSIYTWSGSAWEDTTKNLTVREFTLNSGESYPSGIKGWATFYVNTWVFTTDGCEADDTGL